MNKIKRPIVRYHGGKFKLADWIISFFPKHKGYTEVFGGGASVLLRKQRSYFEVYNDLDAEIVNVFRCVRDNGEELKTALELTPFSREEFEISYEPAETNIERARRTIFRSFSGFGSAAASNERTGFRSNSNRSGTTPAMDWRNYPNHISSFIERLRGVIIENKNYKEILLQHDAENVLHYLDPPYVHSTRSTTNKNQYKFEMSDAEHLEFIDIVKELKGFAIISGYDNEIYRDNLSDFSIKKTKAFADGAAPREEVLYISPNTPLSKTFFD